MPEFAYLARTITGKDVAGLITAGSRREAMSALSDRSLYPLRVESAASPAFQWGERWTARRPIRSPLISATLAQLADLLQNGVSLLPSLDVLAEQAAHVRLAEVLRDVRDQVADGMPLEDAFARHPHVFSELTVNMVHAGAEGGFLEDALRRIADFLELQEELKGRVVGAMAYPVFLAVAGFCVTTILIVFFVPKFGEVFARLEQEGGLPLATVALLTFSGALRRVGWLLLAAAVGLAVWLRRWAKTERGRRLLDRLKLKIPVAGSIFLNTGVSRFCRVLGTLLRNGVPLLKSLDISSESTGNVVLADAIRRSAENVSSGETLSQPLADCGLIPRSVMAMIRVAEESNNLDNVLIHIADGIDRRISRELNLLVRLLEPFMLLVMGGVILFVLVALLLPVFEMSAELVNRTTSVVEDFGRKKMKNPRTRRVRPRAFTLMELLVVLAILVLLFAMVGPRFLSTQKKADIKLAQTQIGMLKSSLQHYVVDVRDYPTTEQGLAALIEAPSETEEGETKWAGPYLSSPELPKDPWGHEYQYEYPPTHGSGDEPDLWSWGPDGEDNTEDDIVSWLKEAEEQ